MGEDGPGWGHLCHTDTFLVFNCFKLACMKVQGAIVVTLTSELALASHFNVLRQSFLDAFSKRSVL